ncbi:MAG: amidase [Candidatus Latescibacterota bacterium]|nr:amidase [Candidatus Latescibacterota bacterium]
MPINPVERIDQIDKEIHSFLEEPGRQSRLESAIAQNLIKNTTESLPLYGQYFGLKDIFHYDGLPTGAGSRLPVEVLRGGQGTCVTKLEQAGAIMLGKTATTEFAYFEPSRTRNPCNIDHTPGGSSSGSAAAVAAGLCDFALGTQTVGSIIRPAAYCGIIGFKPSFGRVETSGLIYFSPSVDSVGFFSQNVEDVGSIASVVCSDWRAVKDISYPRIGIPNGEYMDQCSPEGQDHFYSYIRYIRTAGFSVIELDVFGDIAKINSNHRSLIASEIAQVHSEWFERYRLLYRRKTAQIIEEGREIKSSEIRSIQGERERFQNKFEAFMDDNGIEIWLSPSATGPAPFGLDQTGDPCMNLPWSFLGVPALNIPLGRFSNGLPGGLQCTSRFGSDEKLIAWGSEFHKMFSAVTSKDD